MPALYVDHLQGFVENDAEQLLGRLTVRLAEEGFPSTTDNTFAWVQEIAELQVAFRRLIELVPRSENWRILLEYVLPVVGKRVGEATADGREGYGRVSGRWAGTPI
jgi:hypothetical protein